MVSPQPLSTDPRRGEDHQMLHETTTGILIFGMLVNGRDGTS